MAAAYSLADLAGMKRLWDVRRTEFFLVDCGILGCRILGVLPGIAIAVGLSILNVFRRSWWRYSTSLGPVDRVSGYHDVRFYPEAKHIDGLVVFDLMHRSSSRRREHSASRSERWPRGEPKPRWIVIAAEPITDVDTTAADMLEDLDEALNAQGISLVFAELKDPVRAKIERYELTRTIDPSHFFPTIEAAVAAFRSFRTGDEDGSEVMDSGQGGID